VLTYAVQHQIDMGTPGAKIIGEALKVNTSLLGLGLVSFFFILVLRFASRNTFVYLKCVATDLCGAGGE
jgi:hypothetical protein